MILFTLDTNVISAILRGKEQVMFRLEAHIAQGHLVTLNAISYYETRRGLSEDHQSRRRRFDLLVEEAGVLDMDRAVLDLAAQTYQALRRRGALLEDADILIAATALAHDAILVTRNTKHLERIEGLRLENWEN
ncbi:MAG TPA: type II toxin-antitoxin system VapC family toxin [Chloroflexota bacterium]|nr:type II toxin-antitoxin system VapC family toxin [Chloroflexota bacterium]